MTGRVRIPIDRTADVLRALDALGRDRAYVGIPDGSAGQHKGMSNAQLGYIHENGAPEANIPARPFLAPAAEEVKEEAIKRLKEAGKAALDGKPEVVGKALMAVGLLGQNAARAKISSGLSPALADSTIYNRQHRKRAKRSGTKPLYDTGGLLKSITYVIRPKEGK